LIQIQTDRIHLIFGRADAKPKVRREKKGEEEKNSTRAQPLCYHIHVFDH
jgi:hypothetical protein